MWPRICAWAVHRARGHWRGRLHMPLGRPAYRKMRRPSHQFRLILICEAHNSMFDAEGLEKNKMTRSALIAAAAALLLAGTSLASAKSRGMAGPHSKPSHPAINETTARPTVADPYYRLSDAYYGDSDPYHGLFDFSAVPPYSPGNAYRYVRPAVGR